jgi:glycosyltransferase involved in cell wall biosynthesis
MHLLMIYGRRLAVGGHYRSGLSFARALLRRGHRVSVLFPSALPGLAAAWETLGIETIIARKDVAASAPRRGQGLLASLRHLRRVATLHRRAPIDVIHCQDESGLREGFWAAVLLGCGIVCTRAGGEMRISLVPPTMDFVLYSQELKDAYLQSSQGFLPERLHVIPARFELPPPPDNERPSWPLALHCADPEAPHLFMAMRLKPDKTPWVETLERLMASAAEARTKLHITLAGDGPLRERLEACAADHERTETPVRLHLLGAVKDEAVLQACFRAADAIIGHGRGVIEGMAVGKPAMVMGERGELEWVTPERVATIAYYNYSGRHFRADETSAPPMTACLEKLKNPAELCALGIWSADYVQKKLNVEAGVHHMTEVYRQALSHKPRLIHVLRSEMIRSRLMRKKRIEEEKEAEIRGVFV